ncbi:MAG: MmcQ/YjbR family DNA-binding protein [Acidimicrobiales bacterium]
MTNVSTIGPDRLERLRAICLALPEASEKEAWGDPTWRVRNKIFAMQKGNYEGGRPSVWLKAPPGAQDVLVSADPERFFVPGYVGSKGWIGVYLDGRRFDWDELTDLVEDSFRLIAPKRLAATLDPAPGSND